jgi:uncharacterized RDD family membrane protein YckC
MPAYGAGAGRGPAGLALPSPWKRIGARFLDGLIVGLVFGSIFSAIVLSGDDDGGLAGVGVDASFGKLYLLGLLGAAVGFVWDAVCTKMYGGSPMKLAFGMRVVQADTGAPVEWRHAIIRWAIPGAIALIPLADFGPVINLIIIVVSLVFLFTKPLRQAVWDLAAGTVVVEK